MQGSATIVFFLRKLHAAGLSYIRLMNFYSCVVESLLTYAGSVWYGNSKYDDRVSIDRVIKAAERVIAHSLPRMADIFQKRSLGKAQKKFFLSLTIRKTF